MDENVKKFIEAAKAAERKRYESERDCLLISLGLIDHTKTWREYSDYYTSTHTDWDDEKGKYYKVVLEPIEVSDEEYEEIKKYAPKDTKKEILSEELIGNGAEKFLSVINGLSLSIGIIVSIVLMVMAINANMYAGYILLSAAVVLLVSLISWAIVKVVLNVSNNLHAINSKIK